jgi:capsular exopolysaccharide synthesis family protein
MRQPERPSPMNQLATAREVLPAAEDPAEDRFELVEYWRSISRRKWSILGLALSITLLAAVIVYSLKPIYRSSATMLIETGKSKVVSVEEVYGGMSANREFFQTQAEIMRSRELVRKVITKLGLTKHPEFDPRQQEPPLWRKWSSPIGINSEAGDISEETAEKVVIEQFLSQLAVDPVRFSQLIRISFESTDKEFAARVANAVADAFIESDLEARYQMTQKAADWLNSRVAGLRQKLTESEKALQEYRERERIVEAKGLAVSSAGRQLDDLSVKIVEARQRRAEAENAYNQVRVLRGTANANFESIPAVLRNQLYVESKRAEGETEKKVSELSQRYGKEHPRMVQVEAELRSARENTRRQVENIVSALSKEYEVARANEAAVERSLGDARGQIQGINRKEYQLGILEREVASNKQLYDMFIGRFKETSATNDLQSAVGRVVDRAFPMDIAARPKKNQIIGITFALALLLAGLLALLLDRLDNTIKSSEEVEVRLGVGLLSAVPIVAGRKDTAKRAYLEDANSVFSESIRTARTGVLLSSIDEEHKVLVVTSSIPAEGKTTFAMNLAFAHAQTKKVLLIDADMRRPTIAKVLGLEKGTAGLSEYISGTAQASEVIHAIEGTDAKVLSAGHIPPNPLELLLSPKFKHAVERLKEVFDVIVIDSPPLQLVSDALIISQHATGVVYVVKADETPYQLARQGIKKLHRSGAPLLGVVLNQLDFKKADRYYGGYSGYAKYGYKRYYGSKG